MANRWLNQFKKTFEKEVVSVFARVSFGAAGAPTLDAVNSKGVVSVTRNATGKYTFVFGTKVGMLDSYNRLLLIKHVFDESGNGGSAPASPSMFLVANNISSPTVASVQVQFNAAGVATDPAANEVVLIEFEVRNSNAP